MASEVSIAGAQQDLPRRVAELERELNEAHQREAATAEVLKVISGSKFELLPVLNTIARAAAHLCAAEDVTILLREHADLRIAAHHGAIEGSRLNHKYPLGRGLISGRAVVDRQPIHVSDVTVTGDEFPVAREAADKFGFRTSLGMPLLHEDEAIGCLLLRRKVVRPFDEKQIALLRTFADQAVIAIENARLFHETKKALERQTATAEILKVIASSPSDTRPVFNAIATSANRLLGGLATAVWRFEGDKGYLAAFTPVNATADEALKALSPIRISDFRVFGLLSEGKIAQVLDTEKEPPQVRDIARLRGFRAMLFVPLMSQAVPIGLVSVTRKEPGAFDPDDVQLLQTFADQAVIAIENTRLFEAEQASKRELQDSLQQQTATADVLKVISRSAFDLQSVLNTLTASAARLCRANRANIARVHGDNFEFVAFSGFGSEYSEYMKGLQTSEVDRGSITGRTVMEGRTVHVPDVLADPEFTWFEAQKRGGFRTALGVPLMREGTPIGVFFLTRSTVAPFTQQEIDLASTFADQAVIAIENARLFEEVQARTRELAKTVEDLDIASQHKNQFVANMSHELRTPLAAILGYAELIQEGFYEPQGPKSLDALTRICSNGKHLLGLINTVLDIAKIESGQFTLNMSEYAIESVVETVRAATESLAHNKKLTLTTFADKALPVGLGDEQRLTQVLLNLVGNAIKFTDAGEVRIAAGARNDHFTVSVTDTGPGIPLDQQDRIFDQFHQVDSSLTKATGGTGLGLAIAKQIVEMHGGRIWVESTLGKGSMFQMELPTRAEFRKRALQLSRRAHPRIRGD